MPIKTGRTKQAIGKIVTEREAQRYAAANPIRQMAGHNFFGKQIVAQVTSCFNLSGAFRLLRFAANRTSIVAMFSRNSVCQTGFRLNSLAFNAQQPDRDDDCQ